MWSLESKKARAGRNWILIPLLALVIVSGGCDDSNKQATEPSDDSNYVERRIKYGFTVTNPTNQVMTDVVVSVFSPVSGDSAQKITEIQATEPFERDVSEQGGEEIRFRFGQLAPYSVKDVWITSELELAQRREVELSGDVERYTAEAAFVEVSDPKISALAKNFRAKEEIDSVKNAYLWVVSNIEDDAYVKEDRGALAALTEGKGDCTEQMYLFMALSRALGVPARGVAGFVQATDGVLHARDYHNWAEVYLDNEWRVVDPLREIFLEHEMDYIAMRYIGIGASVGEAAQALFNASPGVGVVFR